MPNGAFYAVKKACEPLHLLYSYGDNSICITNDQFASFRNLKAIIRVFDINSREILNETLDIDVGPDSSAKIFKLPEFNNISTTYFLDLRLNDETNIEIANNLYWLSTRPDILDYEAKVEPWPYYTPSKEFADFNLLNSLPSVKVNIEHRFKAIGENIKVTVKLENVSKYIAFFIELKVSGKKSGGAILPVFWEDNFISLLAGESRKIEAVFAATNDEPVFTINGLNLEAPP